MGKTYNVLEGQIPNFTKGDITLAVIVDGKEDKSGVFPDKKNYKYIETKCNNNLDAEINFDKDTWKLSLSNIDRATICTIVFETKTNSLNGSEPVIKEGLVPVVIADNGTVTKTTIDDINWYNYDEAKWANAVILTGTDTYEVGGTIPEEAIESYFVWIPKYRYKLFNVGGESIPEQEIEIEIGDYNTVNSDTECIATNESGNIGTCSNGKWMTHPAFTSLGVNGLWVGKFETTGSSLNITIKPELVGLGSLTVGSMYNVSYNFNRNLDSHMMKNTEWGAMAYLTNSKYGRGNNELKACINSDFKTGSGDSATNNKSGIYGTNGCIGDSVMGNYDNVSREAEIDVANIDDKYIDRYYKSSPNSCILGDAMWETYGWYGANYTTNFELTWIIRGGAATITNDLGGLFGFTNGYYGGAWATSGFRIVLSPSSQ